MTTLHAVTHGHASAALPVRDINGQDLRAALRAGYDDFVAMPTHVIFVSLLYPIIGLLLAAMTFDGKLIPLLFPLASGFALVGPFAAVGLYELSRRRAQGLDTSWSHAFTGLRRRAVGSLLAVGGLLATIFVCWLVVAQGIYWALYDGYVPSTIPDFVHEVLTTQRGWALIVLGNLAGFAFSLITLAVSVVSVPLIVGRHVDALTALETSVAAFRQNPRTLLAWGFIVAAVLVLGSLPLFVGLAVAMPLLGHATWHLYERIVAA